MENRESKHRKILAIAEAYRRGDPDELEKIHTEYPELYPSAIREVLRDPGSTFGAGEARRLKARAGLDLLRVSPDKETFRELMDYPDAEIAGRAAQLLALAESIDDAYVVDGIKNLEELLRGETETPAD